MVESATDAGANLEFFRGDQLCADSKRDADAMVPCLESIIVVATVTQKKKIVGEGLPILFVFDIGLSIGSGVFRVYFRKIELRTEPAAVFLVFVLPPRVGDQLEFVGRALRSTETNADVARPAC